MRHNESWQDRELYTLRTLVLCGAFLGCVCLCVWEQVGMTVGRRCWLLNFGSRTSVFEARCSLLIVYVIVFRMDFLYKQKTKQGRVGGGGAEDISFTCHKHARVQKRRSNALRPRSSVVVVVVESRLGFDCAIVYLTRIQIRSSWKMRKCTDALVHCGWLFNVCVTWEPTKEHTREESVCV